MRPFKTIDDQIVILENRGLIFTDKEEAKLYLLRNNYYNVVNMYSKVFQDNVNTYIKDTNFNEIKALHIYDTELKTLLMKYVLLAEKHFKSIFAYYFAEKYHNQEFTYLNTANYPSKNLLEMTRTFSYISKTINAHLRDNKNNSVKHNYKKHNDVPIWVMVNELTLGNIIRLYQYTDKKTRNKIARELSEILKTNINLHVKLEPSYIDKMLSNILEIRNCVAHNNKLLNFKCRNNIKYIKEIFSYPNAKPTDSRQTPFDILMILKCFLPYNDFCLLQNSIRKRTINISKKVNSETMDKILSSYGFPNNWHSNISILPQP